MYYPRLQTSLFMLSNKTESITHVHRRPCFCSPILLTLAFLFFLFSMCLLRNYYDNTTYCFCDFDHWCNSANQFSSGPLAIAGFILLATLLRWFVKSNARWSYQILSILVWGAFYYHCLLMANATSHDISVKIHCLARLPFGNGQCNISLNIALKCGS